MRRSGQARASNRATGWGKLVRPATRKFRRELDLKVARLEQRIATFERAGLSPGDNPGYDRLAEALYLKGDWSGAQAASRKAAAYWQERLAAAGSDPERCEPTFHLGSAWLLADDLPRAVQAFASGVALYAGNGMAASDDTGYMACVCGDLRRAEVVFLAAVVADMGAQGMSDLKLFARRFPDTPRLLKLQFVQGLQQNDPALLANMRLMERWLTPEPEGVTSFRTEEWFFAAHQVVLAQMKRGEAPRFRLYDADVRGGLVGAPPKAA
jgi:hypothetical protein